MCRSPNRPLWYCSLLTSVNSYRSSDATYTDFHRSESNPTLTALGKADEYGAPYLNKDVVHANTIRGIVKKSYVGFGSIPCDYHVTDGTNALRTFKRAPTRSFVQQNIVRSVGGMPVLSSPRSSVDRFASRWQGIPANNEITFPVCKSVTLRLFQFVTKTNVCLSLRLT